MSGSCLSNIYRAVRKWNDHHNVFSKAALFISGLVLSHSLVEHTVMFILIDYLTGIWKKQHLPKAVAIINLLEGVTTVLAVVLAHVADSCIGRFQMVVFTTVAYILGLVLLWYSAKFLSPSTEIVVFCPAAVTLAVGKSGRNPPLNAFLADQWSNKENPTEEEQEKIDVRTSVWWRIAWFSGAIIAFFYLSEVNWENKFIVSAIVMGANLFLFLCGFKFYNRQIPNGSPLGIIVGVFKAAISNRHLNYPPNEEGFHWKNDTPSQFYNDGIGQTFLLPKVRFFRWLDKAAIIDEGTNPEDEENRGRLCTVKQVTEVKGVLTLIPLWITFFAYCLVRATGNTFFIEQSSNMNFDIAVDVEVPIVSFFILRSFIRFIITFLFSSKKAREQSVTRIRIAVGMVCSIICCLRARDVEVVRLKIINEKGIDPSDPNQTIPMNVLCLFPQFFWLGLMEGLADEGLQEFFYNHVATSMRSYGPSFSDCVLGFGNFISMPFVLLCRRWFKDSINTSHLDRYYLALAILSSVFLVFYVYASFSVTSVHMGSASENEEANEGEELAEILVDNLTDAQPTRSVSFSLRRRNVGHVDTAEEVVSEESRHDLTESLPTRSVSSSLLKRKLAMAATAISFFLHLKNKTAANADSHESEKLPLRSHAVTEAEGVVLEESRQD